MNYFTLMLNFIIQCVDRLFNKGGSMQKPIQVNLIDTMPNKFPTNPDQDAMMTKIGENSGVAIFQNKRLMLEAMGPKMQVTDGVFMSKVKNPRFTQDVIVMNADAHGPYWYSVLFHEMAHATGTMDRLYRPGICSKHVDAITYAYEEVIAESVARRIMERVGLATPETRECSMKYINRYASAIENFIDQKLLNLEVSAAEALVMEWLQGTDIKAA